MKKMVQNLLADRFQLRFHRESREVPILAVSLGKTAPNLFPPKEGETRSIRISPQMGEDQKIVSYHVVATRFSFKQLNETFSRQLGRVIVNETGLEGDFDFTLDMTPDEERPNPLDPSLVIAAMQRQLGLTVKSRKCAVDFLAIDHAQEVAAGN